MKRENDLQQPPFKDSTPRDSGNSSRPESRHFQISEPPAYPYFVIEYDESLTILSASASVEDSLGYTSRELVGTKLDSLLAPVAGGTRYLSDLHAQRFEDHDMGLQQCLFPMFSRDGEWRVTCVHSYGVEGQTGVISRCVCEDISHAYTGIAQCAHRFSVLNETVRALSPRESTVLSRIREGNTNRSIAEQIGISERGVEHIRSRLVDKFAVSSLTEVIGYAAEHEVLAEVLAGLKLYQPESDQVDTPHFLKRRNGNGQNGNPDESIAGVDQPGHNRPGDGRSDRN